MRARLQPMHVCVGVNCGSRLKGPILCSDGRKPRINRVRPNVTALQVALPGEMCATLNISSRAGTLQLHNSAHQYRQETACRGLKTWILWGVELTLPLLQPLHHPHIIITPWFQCSTSNIRLICAMPSAALSS